MTSTPFARHALALLLALAASAVAPVEAGGRYDERPERYSNHDRDDRYANHDRHYRHDRRDRHDRRGWNDGREWNDRDYRQGHRDGRRDQRRWDRYDDRRDHRGRVVYRYGHAPAPRYYAPRYSAPRWSRGYRVNDYRSAPTYVVVDYGRYGLRHPPRGHHWRRDDRGDWLLVAIASGVIADVIFN